MRLKLKNLNIILTYVGIGGLIDISDSPYQIRV